MTYLLLLCLHSCTCYIIEIIINFDDSQARKRIQKIVMCTRKRNLQLYMDIMFYQI